jgi:hypothetical protein
VQRLERFWSAIETLAGPATVEAEWRHLLGSELDVVRGLLRPRPERATSFPRVAAGGYGVPYEVVRHGPGDCVGVCPETGDTLPLSDADLVVYELDRGRLAVRLADALHLRRHGGVLSWEGTTARLGGFSSPAGTSYRAVLTLPATSGDLHVLVATLLSSQQHPFLLLAPTRGYLDHVTDARIRQSQSLFCSLSEALALNPDGQFRLLEPLASLCPDPERVASPQRQASASGNEFRLEGDFWTLTFAGRTERLKDRAGMTHIAYLLSRPRREVHVMILLAVGAGRDLGRPSRGCPVLDERALEEYRERYDALCGERDEARDNNNPDGAERLQGEINALSEQLKGAIGLGGRTRRAGDDVDRARQSVSKAVTRMIEAITKKHEALGRHLDNAIRMGECFRYEPEVEMDWAV